MIQSKSQKIRKSGKYQSRPDDKSKGALKASIIRDNEFFTKNCVENSQVQTNFKNSNLKGAVKDTESQSFVDQELTSIVQSMVERVVNRSPNEKINKELKLHPKPSPFTLKSSLNSSLVSTSASDDSNSCERSSNISSKDMRSDSINSVENSQEGASKSLSSSSKQLFEIPEKSPNDIFECMMQAAMVKDGQYVNSQPQEVESPNQNLNSKKPVPNKYKTEICRNWELEGFCRFGDECTFAHGGVELNRKASMPSNYKTKVCTQFTEEPFYCPYGEKCQFLHISCNKSNKASNKQAQYSEILNETIKQLEKRIMHLDNFEEFEIPESVFKKPRLSVFENLTSTNDTADEKIQPNSSHKLNTKKTALKLKSREFHMPKKKVVEHSQSKVVLVTGETS